MLDRVYFDNASTTNIHPEVLKSYISLLQKYYVTEDDMPVQKHRSGGFGSTNQK